MGVKVRHECGPTAAFGPDNLGGKTDWAVTDKLTNSE